MIEQESLARLLAEACGLEQVAIEAGLGQEWVAELPAEEVPRAIAALRGLPAWRHLSTITGQSADGGIQLLYHCWLGRGVTLRVRLPREDASAPSLAGQLPGAAWYEREIHELLGVAFAGLPDAPPLLLSESWDGPPPLAEGKEQP
jgi:NADH:ubiquinone oxidoreductase subunit C